MQINFRPPSEQPEINRAIWIRLDTGAISTQTPTDLNFQFSDRVIGWEYVEKPEFEIRVTLTMSYEKYLQLRSDECSSLKTYIIINECNYHECTIYSDGE